MSGWVLDHFPSYYNTCTAIMGVELVWILYFVIIPGFSMIGGVSRYMVYVEGFTLSQYGSMVSTL